MCSRPIFLRRNSFSANCFGTKGRRFTSFTLDISSLKVGRESVNRIVLVCESEIVPDTCRHIQMNRKEVWSFSPEYTIIRQQISLRPHSGHTQPSSTDFSRRMGFIA